MSTFLLEHVDSLVIRNSEIDCLIDAAIELDGYPMFHSLFNSICRSITIMMISHFEGFVKESTRAVIYDLNKFSDFNRIPEGAKRTFCASFMPSNDDKPGKELNDRIKRLIQTFNGLDVKLQHEPFNVDGDAKNPSPNIIDKIARNFGVKRFFAALEGSRLDAAFVGTPLADLQILLDEMRGHLRSTVHVFPYRTNAAQFGLDISKEGRGATNWSSFLDNALRDRHAIAHGAQLDNTKTIAEIKEVRTKLQILKCAYVLVLASHISANDPAIRTTAALLSSRLARRPNRR